MLHSFEVQQATSLGGHCAAATIAAGCSAPLIGLLLSAAGDADCVVCVCLSGWCLQRPTIDEILSMPEVRSKFSNLPPELLPLALAGPGGASKHTATLEQAPQVRRALLAVCCHGGRCWLWLLYDLTLLSSCQL